MEQKFISGYFRLRRGARLYQVRYARTEHKEHGCITGTRIAALAVMLGTDEVLRYERGNWLTVPATPEDRDILDEIKERIG